MNFLFLVTGVYFSLLFYKFTLIAIRAYLQGKTDLPGKFWVRVLKSI